MRDTQGIRPYALCVTTVRLNHLDILDPSDILSPILSALNEENDRTHPTERLLSTGAMNKSLTLRKDCGGLDGVSRLHQ